jgi:cell wall assembly regulator SMI1
MSVRKTWKLQPGQSVKYSQIITVGRDWPMDEALKMVVELVGAPDLKCPMIISATAK